MTQDRSGDVEASQVDITETLERIAGLIREALSEITALAARIDAGD